MPGRMADEASPASMTRRQALALGGLGALSVVVTACDSSTSSGTGSNPGSTGTTAGTGKSGTTTGSAPTVVLDDATKKKLDDLLAQGMKATGIPGVSAGVWIGGSEWRQTLGVADLKTNA